MAILKSAIAPVTCELHSGQLATAYMLAVVPASAVPRTQTAGPEKATPCHVQPCMPALYSVKLQEWLLFVHPS